MQTQTHRADTCTPALLQAAIAAAEAMAEQAQRHAQAVTGCAVVNVERLEGGAA